MFPASYILRELGASTRPRVGAGKARSVSLNFLANTIHQLDQFIHLLLILGIETKSWVRALGRKKRCHGGPERACPFG